MTPIMFEHTTDMAQEELEASKEAARAKMLKKSEEGVLRNPSHCIASHVPDTRAHIEVVCWPRAMLLTAAETCERACGGCGDGVQGTARGVGLL